jgi:hypothetical protein
MVSDGTSDLAIEILSNALHSVGPSRTDFLPEMICAEINKELGKSTSFAGFSYYPIIPGLKNKRRTGSDASAPTVAGIKDMRYCAAHLLLFGDEGVYGRILATFLAIQRGLTSRSGSRGLIRLLYTDLLGTSSRIAFTNKQKKIMTSLSLSWGFIFVTCVTIGVRARNPIVNEN